MVLSARYMYIVQSILSIKTNTKEKMEKYNRKKIYAYQDQVSKHYEVQDFLYLLFF